MLCMSVESINLMMFIVASSDQINVSSRHFQYVHRVTGAKPENEVAVELIP